MRRPTYEQAREALDAQLRHLGFDGVQVVASLQRDGAGGKYHIHAVINRVDIETGKAREYYHDDTKMRAACRETERLQGWSITRDLAPGERGLSPEARNAEYHGRKVSFERRVRDEYGPALRAALGRPLATWSDVHRLCGQHGMRYQLAANGRGGQIAGEHRGEYTKARVAGLSHPELVRRLGAYVPDRRERSFEDRSRSAAAEVKAARSWSDVHVAFARNGLEYAKFRGGGRVADLDGPAHLSAAKVDRALTIGELQKRLGRFETSQATRDREAAREVVRRAENLVLGARLIRDPQQLPDRLTNHDAAFRLRDITKVVESKVDDERQRDELTRAIIAKCVVLQDERGRTRFATPRAIEEERTVRAAAIGLADSAHARRIDRVAGDTLDEQQKRAYDYAVDASSRLKVVTGAPGAGKTTLINEIAAAYESAGFRLRGVSVAWSAAQVLRDETPLDARSVKSELYAWNDERERLTERDVVFIDEVSMLGSEDGAQLLREAESRGAVVIALGDDKQFQSVGRGNALRQMLDVLGDRAIDMEKSRRQTEEWMRDATHSVRAGEIAKALDAYKERGFVHEYAAQDEARAAIVTRWREIETSGVECGIEAYTNAERRAVNELARAEYRAMGRLEGADVTLDTMDGPTPYAVGDRVVIREKIREAGVYNGSIGTVVGIAGATLKIERPEGKVVAVDTREHQGVQHSYCATEFREQGKTRRAELQLGTGVVAQRSMVVGMTRHTHEYGLFYSREEIGNYRELVERASRQRDKELATDFRVVGLGRDVVGPTEMTLADLRVELGALANDPQRTFEERAVAAHLADDVGSLSQRDRPVTLSVDWREDLKALKTKLEHERDVERVQEREVQRERASENEIEIDTEIEMER